MISLQKLSINCEETIDKITKFIRTTVKNTNLNGVVVNISGGIDSAVTLHLAVKALGPEKVTAIMIPERDITPENDVLDVMLHCKQLNLTCNMVDITETLHVMRDILPEYDITDKITTGNIRSRLRMIIAYYFANMEKKLVLGTSNKTEMLTGFFTKYGDGGVDISPLADLWKYNIKELGEYLKIPKSIINKPPSPGFYKGQTDEEELGMSYNNIDVILYATQSGYTVEEIASEIQKTTMQIQEILDRVKANEHKRRLPLKLKLR